MKTLKVGSWFNKFDKNQQEAFKFIMTNEYADINRTRSFLTACKNEFGRTDLVYKRNLQVVVDGIEYYFSSERKDFNKVG